MSTPPVSASSCPTTRAARDQSCTATAARATSARGLGRLGRGERIGARDDHGGALAHGAVPEDGVAEPRTPRHDASALVVQLDRVDDQAGVEAGRETGRDVGGEHGGAEQDELVATVGDHARQRVDRRLRQARRERLVVAEHDARGAVARRAPRPPASSRAAPQTTASAFTERAAARRDASREQSERPGAKTPSCCSAKTRMSRHQTMTFRSTRNSTICAAEDPALILETEAAGLRGRRRELEHLGPRGRVDDADVRRAQRLLRLLLRAHDRLQRRVARVVDRVRDRDDRRERRLDHVVARLGLPLRTDAAAVEGQLRDLRDERPSAAGRRRPRPSRSSRSRRPAGRGCTRSGASRSSAAASTFAVSQMSAPTSVASEMSTARSAPRESALPSVRSAVSGPMQIDDDLAVRTGRSLLQPKGLLDRVCVERVQRALTGAVEPRRRGVDATRGGRIRHFLDADGDLQEELPPGAPAREAGDVVTTDPRPRSRPLASIATGRGGDCVHTWRRDSWNQAGPVQPARELRRKSTIVAVGAPGVKIAATPRSCSACASAVGIVPPTTTSTSSASASRSSSRMRGTSVM